MGGLTEWMNKALTCPLLPPSGTNVLGPLATVNRLSLKQMYCHWGRAKDAIASSDITKAPFVTLIALCGDLRINGIKRPL